MFLISKGSSDHLASEKAAAESELFLPYATKNVSYPSASKRTEAVQNECILSSFLTLQICLSILYFDVNEPVVPICSLRYSLMAFRLGQELAAIAA